MISMVGLLEYFPHKPKAVQSEVAITGSILINIIISIVCKYGCHEQWAYKENMYRHLKTRLITKHFQSS